jgi:thiol reductant ABC exporter CydC subunit
MSVAPAAPVPAPGHRPGTVAAVRAALRLATPGERRRIAVAATLSALAGLAGTALLALSGYLIAHAAQQPPVLSLTVAIVCVRALSLVRAIARYGERLVGHDAVLRTLARLRGSLFSALLPARTGRGRDASAVADAVVADVDGVQDAFLRSVAPLAAAVLVTVPAAVVAGLLLPAAAVVVLGTALVVGVLVPLLAQVAAARLGEARTAHRSAMVRDLAATLDAAEELVAHGAGDRRRALLAAEAAALGRAEDREHRATVLTGAAASALAGLGAVAMLAVALRAVEHGTLDPVLTGLLALLVLGLGEVLAGVPAAGRELHATAEAVARVGDLLGAASPATDVVPADDAIVLRDVTIARAGRTILTGLDLTMGPGERVALIGPSGAGKSTVGDLLVGFLEPEALAGIATVGGADLREVEETALRRLVLHVPQEPYLFDATLRANLLLAAPDADDDALRAALAAVGAGPWLAGLRDGLDTALGERGARCSGGERQRIGLARAVLAPQRTVVLDEPASHLPAADAVAALRAVLDAVPGRGALLVAHRVEERALADRAVGLAA